MKFLIDILRGIFIGIASIIPGVSGGTLALSMGVYEKIISAVNNVRKDFKGSVKTLFPYAIGGVIGVLVFLVLIEFLLNEFPLPTTFAFMGLILGGLPSIYGRVKKEKFKGTHLISFVVFALVIIVSTILAGNLSDGVAKTLDLSFVQIVIMFVLGLISAVSLVVPGVSGSMLLMMLGYYQTLVTQVTTCIKAALAFNISVAFQSGLILIPFGIGLLIGILVCARIIETVMKKYPNATIWAIIALVATSPFAIIYGMSFETLSVATGLVSVLTFVAGFYGAVKLSK